MMPGALKHQVFLCLETVYKAKKPLFTIYIQFVYSKKGFFMKKGSNMIKITDEKIDKLFMGKNNGQIYDQVISDTEKILIEKALKRAFGNQSIAAKLLGISRATFYR